MSEPMSQKRERTIAKVVKEYGAKLFGFIRNRVPTTADAEDILQDVWYQFSNVVDADSIDQLSGWLFQVARNRVTDKYRKKKTDLIEDYTYEGNEGDVRPNELELAEFPAPEDEDLREIFWEVLFVALDELPQKQREVFVWNELEDQTFQEIADRTGENIKTLISRKRYAVKHLQKRLESLYKEFLS